MENLLNCHGRRFSARIYGVWCEGKITVQGGNVYLCQNEIDGTCDCRDLQGFHFAWFYSLAVYSSVTDFQLLPEIIDPSTYKDWQVGDKMKNAHFKWTKEVIFRNGKLIVCKSTIGDVTVNFNCDALFEYGWRLIVDQPKPEPVKGTMQEISDWKGVDIKLLKIEP